MIEINLCTIINAPIERCFDLSRSIDLHKATAESSGEQAVGGVTSGLIGRDEFVRWRARHFGVMQTLASKITAYDRPRFFQDTMIEGAFRFMQHDHHFTSLPDGQTEMRDDFRFAAPVPILGMLVDQFLLRRYMTDFLQHRNEILKRIAESEEWNEYLRPPRYENLNAPHLLLEGRTNASKEEASGSQSKP